MSIPLAFLVLTYHADSHHLQMRPVGDNHVNKSQAGVTTRVMSFMHGTARPLWQSACYYEHASQERRNTSRAVVAINRIFVSHHPFLWHAVASDVVLLITFFITVLPRSKRVQYNHRMKMWPILRVAHVSEAPRFSFFSPLRYTSRSD